ncbi:MAG: hypothetical protein NC084_01820 [Bacteroides sp.]|nr:hypothetical protein [Eubacterium sp.]MCM1417376.1 hypothetical protein [Roseburia sp.]MCM1461432.1 hypothetical protein [Bacteroides sp.]
MIIGVDCDGVLTDMTAYICRYGEKWFKRKPVDPCGESVSEIFGVSEKEEFRFGLRYFFTYCRKWPPRENAAEVVEKLGQCGHIPYQITARKFVTSHDPLGAYSRYLYRQWLRKNGFHFRGIFFCSEKNALEDKLAGCRKLSVDVMIDDRSDIALHLAKNGIRVLLFNTPYNQGTEGENIIRVYDWNDVFEKIAALSGEG